MTTSANPPLRLSAQCPDDLIAIASLVLGFTPADSVVMLTFGADQPFHARVDLPDASDPQLAVRLRETADLLLDPARRHEVGHVALLVFSDHEILVRRAWRTLRDAARSRALRISEALRVTPTHWYPLLHGDADLRLRGAAYDVSAHPFVVRAVVHGRVTHASREQLAAQLEPDGAAVVRVLDLMLAHPPWPLPEDLEVEALLREGAWVEGFVRTHVEARSRPGDADVVRLLRAIQLVRCRDAAWGLMTRATAAAHLDFWVDVVRRCPAPLLPPAATMAAWAAWQAGDGALAWCGIDRCLDVDPEYSLAHLLAQLLTAATPPSFWEGGFDWRSGLAG